MKAADIRDKSKEELQKQLLSLRKELLELRVQKVTGGNNQPKFQKIGIVRKAIARVLTVINQTQREHLLAFHKDKGKYLPLDLRQKKTRAIRRRRRWRLLQSLSRRQPRSQRLRSPIRQLLIR